MTTRYDQASLGSVAEIISGQHILSRDYNSSGKGMGYLTGPSDFGDVHPTVSKWTTKPKAIARKGDVLVTVKGSGVGKVNISVGHETAISRQLMAIRSNKLNHQFLFWYLVSRFDELQGLATGAAIPGLSRGDIAGREIPLPPLPEQMRVVAILDEALAAIATTTANAERNLASARGLLKGRLDQVFGMPSSNWAEATVAELAKHSLGKMLDKRKNRGEFRSYLRNLNVRWFDFDLSDVLEMRFEESEHKKYIAEAGDLLICEGGYPGRAAIWPGPEPIHFQKAIHRVRFHDPCHTEWFQYFLYYLDATGDIRKYFTGAGIQHLTGKSLAKVSLLIPPPEEIASHVAGFEEIRTEANRLSRIYEQKLTLLAELKQSILHKAFTGELTADFNADDVVLSKGEV